MRLAAKLKNGREYVGIFTIKEILAFDPTVIEISETISGRILWSK